MAAVTLAAVLKIERDILATKQDHMVTPSKTATPVQRTCTCRHSTKGRVQDAVADDADHTGLVFWTFTEGRQHPGNRALA